MPGLEIDRVAEILVTLGADEPRRRGSGYRVTAETVLTASHVVRDAAKVTVRLDADQAGQWSADVTDVLEVPEIDVALLTIAPPDSAKVIPVQFGRIGEQDAVIECSTVGFPLWKLRDYPAELYRDSAHIVGTAAILANRREGTLEITVAPPERDPDPNVSPWQGMSGAAVFCNGRIVGVISKHHRSDGLGRLAASRVDGWRARVSSAQQQEMNARLGMRPWLRKLEDVIAPSPQEMVTAAYLAQVRDIAPDVLVGRDEELAELVAFCAGPDTYQWWQGDPWAGKTALTAWFVLHPPTGVRIASFFITARLDDQSDSTAFTEAMIDQLAVIADEPASPGTSAAARDGLRRHLIEAAAARLGERGERLVLVVDGLDEDTGARPGGGRASIASLLPRHPPDSVRVLVTSREQPPLPSDVRPNHPLHTCRKRKLAALPFAYNVAMEAENELQLRLHADGGDREVIALITAAGGGLTAVELAELTGRRQFEIQARLGTVLGRSLYSRARYEAEDERVYLFAHETLRATADKILHADLGHYRDKIHEWADKYQAQGWPETTPRYLLRPYGRLLTASGDLRRLAAVAADAARHDLMLQRIGADVTALTEITAAQDRLLAEAIPDLKALLLLAAERYRIVGRTEAIPAELPAVWARLGRIRHAVDLARSITNPATRATALAGLAAATAADPVQAGDLAAEAEQAARTATGSGSMLRVLLHIAVAFARRDPDHALRLAGEAEHLIVGDPYGRVLADIVRVHAAAGNWDSAEAIAGRIGDELERAQALAEIARNLADSDPARAARLADAVEDEARDLERYRPGLLADLAATLADSDPARAARLADEAEGAARAIAEPLPRVVELASVASALAKFDPPRAALLARDAEHALRTNGYAGTAITGPPSREMAQDSVALALADAGLPDEAERAVHDGIGRRWDGPDAGVTVAEALVNSHPAHAARLAEEAERAARTITYHWWDTGESGALAEALAAAGELDRAEQVAATIVDSTESANVLTALAEASAEAGQPDRAQRMARMIPEPDSRTRALALVASALVTSQPQLAASLAEEVPCQFDDSIPDGSWAIALAGASQALAGSHPRQAAQLAKDAETFAKSSGGTFRQDALVAVVGAYAATGQFERAERIADSLPGLDDQSRASRAIAAGLAGIRQWEQAEHTAHDIFLPEYRARALADVGRILVGDQPRRAANLFADAEQVARTVADSEQRTATQLAVAWAQGQDSSTDTDAKQRLHRLLAQALSTDRWPSVLPKLGKRAPEAVVALHDSTQAQWQPCRGE